MDRSSSTVDTPRRERTAETLRAALEMATDAVLFVAPHSLRLVDVNHAACTSLGYRRAELLQMGLEDIAPAAGNGRLGDAIGRVVRAEVPAATIRSVHRRSDGSEFPVEASLCRVNGDGDGLLVLVATDIGDSRQTADHTSDSVARDPLTGLLCRTSLPRRLEWEVHHTRKSGGQFAVLFLDVDHFKRVNDKMGHLAGDEVLRTVAERLVGCLRPTDVALRYGGDEFIAIVTGVRSVEDVVRVARRIRRSMRGAINAAGRYVRVSASIGIAMGGNGSSDPRKLLDGADRAMYRAKARGRRGFFAVHRSRKGSGSAAAGQGVAVSVAPVPQPSQSYGPRVPR